VFNFNKKDAFKLISLNIAVLAFILLGVETLSVLGRFLLKKQFVGYIVKINYQNYLNSLKDPCNRFVSHPILGHTHEINEECKVKNGKIIGPYILYDYGSQNKNTIVTLGGSTTDGFFNHFNNGITWSTELARVLEENSLKYAVLNGGVGAYGSSQELIKLLIDIPRIQREKKIKYVISLNGINELPGYRNKRISSIETDRLQFSYKLPLWNYFNIKLINSKKYLKQSTPIAFTFLPSTNTFFKYFLSEKGDMNLINNAEKKWLKQFDLPFGNFVDSDPYQEAATQWEYNVKSMHAIAASNDAEYFVFLQPTMGLKTNQIPKNRESNDYEIYKNLPPYYEKNINTLYKELRLKCQKLEYCIDISSQVSPEGDLYSDARHHNEQGNKKMAKIIYNNIFKNNLVN